MDSKLTNDIEACNNCNNQCKNVILELNKQIKNLTQIVDEVKNDVRVVIEEKEKDYRNFMNRKCEIMVILSRCKVILPSGIELGNCDNIINLLGNYISKKTSNIDEAKVSANCFVDLIADRGLHYGTVAYAHDVHWGKTNSSGGKFKNQDCWEIVGSCVKLVLDNHYRDIRKK